MVQLYIAKTYKLCIVKFFCQVPGDLARWIGSAIVECEARDLAVYGNEPHIVDAGA